MRAFCATIVCCWILFVIPRASLAQSQSLEQRVDHQLQQIRRDSRVVPNPDVPAAFRSSFDYGLYLTANYLHLDDAEVRGRQLQEYDLTLYTHINLDQVHDFLFRGVIDYRDEKPFGIKSEEGVDKRIERLYYRYDLGRAIAGKTGQLPTNDIAFQVGRDLQFWGTGLTLVRELDAATADFTLGEKFGLRLMAATTPHDQADIDRSRPGYLDDTHRDFFGALASARLGNHRPFAYVLVQRDHNANAIRTEGFDPQPTGGGFGDTTPSEDIDTHFDYNSIYWGIGSNGAIGDRLVYGTEFTLETGHGLSRNERAINPTSTDDAAVPNLQTRDPIHAWAANFQLDYLAGDAHNTRFTGEAIYATGDHDRLNSTDSFSGNRPDTADHGFIGFGQLNTGVAYNPDVSNLICLRGGASTFPFTHGELLRRMQIGFDCFTYFKASASGGLEEASTKQELDGNVVTRTIRKRYVGAEGDLFLNWQITSDVTMSMRYGCFFPGAALVNNDEQRHAVFLSMTIGL